MVETLAAALGTVAAVFALAVAAHGVGGSTWGSTWGSTRGSWPYRSPYVGGGTVETHAWSRFHARYLPMTLVFVAFEMEMMFMYPWAVVYVQEGVKALADMGVFLGLLGVGVLYAWREGAFRWQ